MWLNSVSISQLLLSVGENNSLYITYTTNFHLDYVWVCCLNQFQKLLDLTYLKYCDNNKGVSEDGGNTEEVQEESQAEVVHGGRDAAIAGTTVMVFIVTGTAVVVTAVAGTAV